ncbi:TIM barrel protein [Plantibacter sp. Mn2098]|uniref:TIM barrel protein n=1 Tax=Plantibacter sp. Mn2098 TaxID=3395266 RepID=UPI003BC9F128
MRIAGAPVSFGVFELEPEEGAELPGPDDVAAALHDTGYQGIDLGPVGFLGRGAELQERLRRYELSLVGGWVDLPFHDDAAFEASLPALAEALDNFIEGSEVDPEHLPLPTLAASATPDRQAQPGGGEGLSLDEAGWTTFANNVQRAAALVRERGLEPTFHHHTSTYVETPAEIDEFLARTDVGLTLDTGHLIIGGGDPLEGLKRWSDRINHVHLKDARIDRLREILAAGGGMREVWSGEAFVALGAGDLDLEAVMEHLTKTFDGWLVIEQDVIPRPGDTIDRAIANQRINREALRKWLP